MSRNLCHGIGRLISVLLFCLQVSAQATRIDLRQWGYQPVKDLSSAYWSLSLPHIVSVGSNGNIAVGFVTRDRTGLVTRQLPAFSFHVLQFTKGGALLFQKAVPTDSWWNNAVFCGIDGTLLVRTGIRLSLFSAQFETIGEMDLPSTSHSRVIDWQIYPLPSRTAFILYRGKHEDTSIELISLRDFKRIKSCAYTEYAPLISVSGNSLLALHNGGSRNPLLRTVEAAQICGPTRFFYAWEGDPTNAVLVGEDGMLLAGGGVTVRYVVGNKIQWKDAFVEKREVISDDIEVDQTGQFAVIAVAKFTGGSEFLDIPGKLKAIRIVGYEVASGRRTWDLRVEPVSNQFDFAVSPQGDLLATISDGVVQVISK